MKNPTQCHLWDKENLTAKDLHDSFAVVERFVEEPHHSRSLRRCKECGQLYFHEFYEWVDWVNGNDPQYQTYIPVESRDEIETLLNATKFTLLAFSPRLQSDFPKDAQEPKVYWIRGSVTAQ
jgi:hypothetical protein